LRQICDGWEVNVFVFNTIGVGAADFTGVAGVLAGAETAAFTSVASGVVTGAGTAVLAGVGAAGATVLVGVGAGVTVLVGVGAGATALVGVVAAGVAVVVADWLLLPLLPELFDGVCLPVPELDTDDGEVEDLLRRALTPRLTNDESPAIFLISFFS
jgi:hypothetical protein